MQIGFPIEVQGTSPVTSVGVTWKKANDLGVLLFACNYSPAEPSISSITGSHSGPWTHVGSYADTNAHLRHLEAWVGYTAAAVADTLTIAYSGSATWYDVVVAELTYALVGVVTTTFSNSFGASTSQSGTTAQPLTWPSITSSTTTHLQSFIGLSFCSGVGSAGSTAGFSYYPLAGSANLVT